MKLFDYSDSLKAQFWAGIIVNIASISHGICVGWLSPALLVLKSEDTPLATGPLAVDQISNMGALFTVGAIFGAFIFVSISHKCGRKFVFYFLACPQIIYWLIVIFAESYWHLYVGRLIAGMTGGGAFSTIPLFVADVSQNKYSGRLGTILPLTFNFGILISYIIGALVDYKTYPYVGIIFPIVYPILTMHLPETPQALIKRNQLIKAIDSYKYYRGIARELQIPKNLEHEYNAIAATTRAFQDEPVQLEDLTKKDNMRGLLITISLMFLHMFTGGFTIISYAATVFADSGSTINPNTSSIIVGTAQIIGCYVSTIVIDRAGRKILLIISLIGMAFGLFALGTFSYLNEMEYDVTPYSYISIISISFYIFMACLGILTVPFVVLTDVLPSKLRSHGSLISIVFLLSCGTIILKIFPILSLHLGLYGCVWILGGVSVAGAVYVTLIVPETKRTTLNAPRQIMTIS